MIVWAGIAVWTLFLADIMAVFKANMTDHLNGPVEKCTDIGGGVGGGRIGAWQR